MYDAVREAGLLAPGRAVVVMFSGGRDSTCLLHLAVRIAGVTEVSAVHANYRLRGAADADERHCAEVCDALGVQLDVRRPVRPSEARPARADRVDSGNLQAWARVQRYQAADELAIARQADVAAGHTRSDQVETILYRIASSPSRRALLGMRAKHGTHPRLIRPLLDFTREETEAYCTEHGLRWRDDESNESSAYARNRIRHDLVPAFARVHPAAQENLLALATVLRDEADVLDGVVHAALEGRDEIALTRLRELAPAVRRLVVQRLADAVIDGPAAGVARRADEVAALREGGELHLPQGICATVRDGVVRLGRTERERSPRTPPGPGGGNPPGAERPID